MLFVIFLFFLFKIFVFSIFKIPSESMLPNIWPGDWIIVNKLGYGGFLNLFGKEIQLPFYQTIQRGDIMVFHFPEGDTVLKNDPIRNYYELKRWLEYQDEKDKLLRYGDRIKLPIKHRIAYVKRCMGLPGDTIEINNGMIIINGLKWCEDEEIRHLYEIQMEMINDSVIADIIEAPYNGWRTLNGLVVALSVKELIQIQSFKGINNIRPIDDHRFYINRFPFVPGNELYWSPEDFHAVFIPKVGSSIVLSEENLLIYKRVIETYEHNHIKVSGDSIYINGSAVDQYTFKQNYYFVMGDNRSFSMDSRNWGFVPEDHIIGNALRVGWSAKRDQDDRLNIRFDRIGNSI